MTIYFLFTYSYQTCRHGVSEVCIQLLPKGKFFKSVLLLQLLKLNLRLPFL